MSTTYSFSPDLIGVLRRARAVFVLTGAGISAESGVPTYRDAEDGVWTTFNPAEYASPAAWRQNPERVWQWYVSRRETMREARPNAAHLALAAWEQRVPEFTLATQNIDGLHSRAGSRRVIELHGNLFRQRPVDEEAWLCPMALDGSAAEPASIQPARRAERDNPASRDAPARGDHGDEGVPQDQDVELWRLVTLCRGAAAADTSQLPPVCADCGARIRPDVVWFGEALSATDLYRAFGAAAKCDLCLVIGTSSTVEPAASLAFAALEGGAAVVEVNPEATPLSRHATFSLRGPAGTTVPALLEVSSAA